MAKKKGDPMHRAALRAGVQRREAPSRRNKEPNNEMQPNELKKVPVTIYLDPDTVRALEERVERQRATTGYATLSRGDVIRAAIAGYLEAVQ